MDIPDLEKGVYFKTQRKKVVYFTFYWCCYTDMNKRINRTTDTDGNTCVTKDRIIELVQKGLQMGLFPFKMRYKHCCFCNIIY